MPVNGSQGRSMNHVTSRLLTDSRGISQHLNNTLPTFFYPDSSMHLNRSKSEPPCSSPFIFSFVFPPKDDAYHILDGKGYDKKSFANSTNATKAHPSQPNARQLLDPKSFKSTQRQIGSSNLKPTMASANTSQKRAFGHDEEHSIGNLIEKVHNIAPREEQPRKRIKTKPGEVSHSGFKGGSKGGEIGEYMKQKRKEGQEMSTSTRKVIDLTGNVS